MLNCLFGNSIATFDKKRKKKSLHLLVSFAQKTSAKETIHLRTWACICFIHRRFNKDKADFLLPVEFFSTDAETSKDSNLLSWVRMTLESREYTVLISLFKSYSSAQSFQIQTRSF